jgi:Cu(I)/Ag(I) efflux system periplasmic protein CusF
MKKQTTLALALVAALTAPAYVLAQDAHHGHGAVTKASSAAAALADGEVKKVDKDAGKMTIKHGPIENLGMSNMTMVFRVKDPAMLDQVKPGDKIRFAADKVNGALTVTKIEAAK